MTRAVALVVALTAACASDPDPCADVTTACVALRVESRTVDRLDQLELDVLHGDRHATATTAPANGGAVSLPLVTAIVLEPSAAIEVGVVAAGKLGAQVVGTGAAETTVEPGGRVAITIELSPIGACVDGGLYCGGDKLAGDADTLYVCDLDSVPKARGRCIGGCQVSPTADDSCRGVGGPCTNGGFYCGGDELDGDPRVLYRCESGVGVRVETCADRCVIETNRDDHCA